MILRRIERLDEAVALLDGALQSGLNTPALYTQTALLRLTLGQNTEALSLAERGAGLFPDDPELRLALGLALATDPERRNEAVTNLKEALDAGVRQPGKAHLELGSLLLAGAESGCDEDGLGHLKKAASLLPQMPEAHFRLGNAFRACGQSDEAVASLKEFQRLNRAQESKDHGDRSVGTELNRVQELAAEGRLTAALEAVDKILVSNNDDRAWNLKAKILFSAQRADEAVEAAVQAREAGPGRVENHYLEGFLLSRSGRLKEARQALERALALDARQPEAQGLLAAVLADLGDLEQAAEHFQRAFNLGAEQASLRLAYAQVLAELGRDEESRRQMELYRALSGG